MISTKSISRMLKKIGLSAAAAPLLLAGFASAQTTTSTTTTPGVPNTGAGDVVINAMILGASAMIAIGGALYLYMQRRMMAE